MSEVKVNKITPTADCGTVTLGDSGDTVAIPAGATLTSGGAITNSGTITNTGTISGGTITGNIAGLISWQTTVKTAAFTATAGEGYFVNTTSAAITVTLPASPSAGDIVGIKDYANTADTNNITIARNGEKIQGTANDFIISTEGLSIVLLYVDSTQGWLSVGQSQASDISDDIFITATGGTVTTCGDFKIHTFTGPGTFCVTAGAGPVAVVDYLILAGGGSGGGASAVPGGGGGGGGGAGGYRFSDGTSTGCYTAGPAPLGAPNLPISVQAYPVTVGAGGARTAGGAIGNDGSNSIFSTITSTGGGGGGDDPSVSGRPGGSGGGGGGPAGSGGTGNTPPVSPSQGNNGGGPPGGSGGGGAGAAGSPSSGGAGLTSCITASPVGRGGGGASGWPVSASPGGFGAGGGAGNNTPGGNAAANKGGGGGGAGGNGTPETGGAGGSGIVVIRYKFQ